MYAYTWSSRTAINRRIHGAEYKDVQDTIESQKNDSIDSGLTDSIGLSIARLYIEYIHEMDSKDNRRLYIFGFIIMVTQFLNY